MGRTDNGAAGRADREFFELAMEEGPVPPRAGEPAAAVAPAGGRAVTPLSVKEAAGLLGVSAALVYALCRSGELPHTRYGLPGRRGTIRIRRDDLEAFVLRRRVGGGQEPPPDPAPGGPALAHVKMKARHG